MGEILTLDSIQNQVVDDPDKWAAKEESALSFLISILTFLTSKQSYLHDTCINNLLAHIVQIIYLLSSTDNKMVERVLRLHKVSSHFSWVMLAYQKAILDSPSYSSENNYSVRLASTLRFTWEETLKSFSESLQHEPFDSLTRIVFGKESVLNSLTMFTNSLQNRSLETNLHTSHLLLVIAAGLND